MDERIKQRELSQREIAEINARGVATTHIEPGTVRWMVPDPSSTIFCQGTGRWAGGHGTLASWYTRSIIVIPTSIAFEQTASRLSITRITR